MNITDVCLNRPVFAWMIMAGTILFGLLAVQRIGVSQFPDVDQPTVSVSISWPGASPEDVETGLVNPIEDALAQVSGVLTLSSTAQNGSARITATFDLSRNIDLALQDTQAKIAQIQRQLPASAMAPTISKSNPDDQPILNIGVSGPFAPQLLADVARYQVQDALQTIPGVGQVQLNGYVDRNIRIWIDADRLVGSGVVTTDVIQALQKQHVISAGGQMDDGGRAIDVRMLGEAQDLDELRNIVVRTVNGYPVRVKDVAFVQDGFADVTSVARMNGQPVQAMGILKQPGSNAVGVARAVRAALDGIQKGLPPGMKVEVIFDTTQFIEESVSEIGIELGLAVILTAIVCWLFLGSLSSTMNVLFAIPMSLLGTIAVLYFAGFTLNTFTLLGLSLAVGLVVDDAVMVMENIYRHAEMGKDRFRASSEGTKEITFAALAATIAVIAIFMPVAFMSGIIGKFFLQFGVTLSVAVALSYIEAITLAPARCAQMLKTTHHTTGLGKVIDRAFERLSHFYASTLRGALRFPVLVILVGFGVLASAWWAQTKLKQEFVPAQDQSRFQISFSTTVGSDLKETDRYAKKIELALERHPEVIGVLTTVSLGGGNLSVTLVPAKERKMSQQDLMQQINGELRGILAGAKVQMRDPSLQFIPGSRGGAPVDFTLRPPPGGADWGDFTKYAVQLRDEMDQSGILTGVQTDYQLGAPELEVRPDRPRAADLGVNVSDIATAVSTLTGGSIVGQYSSKGRRMNINVRLLATQRSRPEDLNRIYMRAASGSLVPLGSVVITTEKAELQEINHADRERSIRFTAQMAPGKAQSDGIAYAQELQAKAPSGYRLVMGGQSSQFSDAMTSLLFALLVGILVAYMVLASQFNSFLHPVTVLTILPLSVAGAMFALLIAGKTLNIFSMIGLLLLMGIVKKNSIILVDYANEVRGHENLDALGAMTRAGPVRLRPILMTAIATMMAAVPSSLGLGPGAETRGPMADAVIGGLVLSTALSLYVVPAFYVVADRLKRKLGGTKPAAAASLVRSA